MTEYVSRDIHPCKCGRMVAWLPTNKGGRLPYEIHREITTLADGARTVVVCTEDFHYCARYPRLGSFIQDSCTRSRRADVRLYLPTGNKTKYVVTYKQGETRALVSNGQSGASQRTYGSLNVRNGGYRVRRPSNGLKELGDLLGEIDRDPIHFDWSRGRTQTTCCICGRPLSDARSVRWGYGPTCAKHAGLPWY